MLALSSLLFLFYFLMTDLFLEVMLTTAVVRFVDGQNESDKIKQRDWRTVA